MDLMYEDGPVGSPILWRAVREIAKEAPDELQEDLAAIEDHLWEQLSDQILRAISGFGPEVTSEVHRKLVMTYGPWG